MDVYTNWLSNRTGCCICTLPHPLQKDLSTREASPVTSIKAMTGPSMPNISTIVEDLMSKVRNL